MKLPNVRYTVRRLMIVVALAAINSAVVLASSDPRVTPLSPEQRQANLLSLDMIWTTVKAKYWDATLGGREWDARRNELRPRIERARTMTEARQALREMLGRLKGSHFKIHAADVDEDSDTASAEAGRDGWSGIDVRVIDGQALVLRVSDGSPAQMAGVHSGWQILSFNGTELQTALQAANHMYRSSTRLEDELAGVARRHLSGKVGQSVGTVFHDNQGRVVAIRIPFAQRPGRRIVVENMPRRYVEFHSRLLEGDIGYISFNAWYDPVYLEDEVARSVKRFKGTKGGHLGPAR